MSRIRLAATLAIVLGAGLAGRARADFSVTAVDNATIQPAGPRTNGNADPTKDPGKYFFNIEGSNNGNFSSFGVVDFKAPTGTMVSGVSSLSLVLTESNAAFSHAGALNFYLTQDTTTSIDAPTSPLKFDAASLPDGLGTQLSPHTLLGTGTFNTTGNTGTGTVDTYTFSLTAAESSYVTSQINGGGLIRLIVTPGDSTVAATWAGFSTNKPGYAPVLSVKTAAVPEPASLLLLSAGAGLAWVRRRRAA